MACFMLTVVLQRRETRDRETRLLEYMYVSARRVHTCGVAWVGKGTGTVEAGEEEPLRKETARRVHAGDCVCRKGNGDGGRQAT